MKETVNVNIGSVAFTLDAMLTVRSNSTSNASKIASPRGTRIRSTTSSVA